MTAALSQYHCDGLYPVPSYYQALKILFSNLEQDPVQGYSHRLPSPVDPSYLVPRRVFGGFSPLAKARIYPTPNPCLHLLVRSPNEKVPHS